jgi:predicted DNA-binding transcriptional regulator AlpA
MDYQLSDEFLTIDDACRIIGGSHPISRATFYRQVHAGRFPAPVHPYPGISRVRRSELIAAIASATERR